MNRIEKLHLLVKDFLEGESCGHDIYHAERVLALVKVIGKDFTGQINESALQACALVHDICRPYEKQTGKSHFGKEALQIIAGVLKESGYQDLEVKEVLELVRYHDIYDVEKIPSLSLELQIHQDADRLDAIGAVGIARAFAFGGANALQLYCPGEVLDFEHVFVESPDKRTSTVAHFYEKLLKLKNQMHTETGKQIAMERDLFMRQFLERFFTEWNLEF